MRCLILILAILFNLNSAGQERIVKGTKACIDGILDNAEWSDAKEYHLTNDEFIKCRVLLKHDDKNLLLCYIYDQMPDSAIAIPEFFIDSRADKGKSWQPDDYWFHVSAQDCYAVGKREDYKNCRADYLVWRASPNWHFDKQPYTKIKAIEIAVPLTLINLKQGQQIGLCFSLVVYPNNKRFNFPVSSNEDIPESWKPYYLD